MADDFLSIMKVLPDPVGGFMQGQQDAATLAQTQAQTLATQSNTQNQQWNMQNAQTQAQAQSAQDAAYQADLAHAIQNPTADAMAGLKLKYPDQAKGITDAWNARDAAVNNADRQQLANVHSLLSNGYTDLAKKQLQARLAADQQAGRQEPMVQSLLDAIDADPKHAIGISAVMLSSIPGGEDFAKTLKSVGDNTPNGKTKGQVVGRAIGHYDDSGHWVTDYRDPDGVKYEKIKNTDGTESIVAVGGDGPAQPGASTGQRTTGGWTPRRSAGGDNSDAAVDGKIGGMASALGVDPNADISHLGPMAIAQALTLSEGGAGSIADRNNNSGNLRNADGSYMKFATKQAGLNAAAALVARKLKNGQTSIRTLVEGLPVGGPAQGVGHVVATSQGGGDQAAFGIDPTLTGDAALQALPPTAKARVQQLLAGRSILTAREKSSPLGQQLMMAANQVDSLYDEGTAHARVKANADFTGNGKAAMVASSGNRLAYHINDLWDASNHLAGPDLRWSPLSNVATSGAQAFQQAQVAKYNAILPFVSGELQKLTKNGQSTESETKHIMDNLRAGQPTSSRNAAIQELVQLAQGQFKPFRDQYASVFGPSKKPPVDFTPTTQAIFDSISNGGAAIKVDHNGNLVPTQGAQVRAPAAAVNMLKQNPALRAQFDAKYGAGASAQVLGR